jgi:dTDP-4-amino-4,6-dideoxygalactose transaminase
MYIPTFQGLGATDLIRPAAPDARRFPFRAAHRLTFYRARNAIYHLFRALGSSRAGLKVLAPDYNSGNEVLAMRAAGAAIDFCTVGRDMQLDPDAVERLCKVHDPDVLYVIHYLGWPQPMRALMDLCRRREMLLVEDCALALLSDLDERPLGSFGHWSIFCLYKTLPVPNGAILVQNAECLAPLDRLKLRRAGLPSVLGRTSELIVQRVRGRLDGVGAALQAAKRGMGRAAGALDVARASVGDIGFNLEEADLEMSGLSAHLLDRLNFAEIRRRRVQNFRQLAAQLGRGVTAVHASLADGVCPLFYPILVDDKHAAARALRERGVAALEFWNHGASDGDDMSDNARFLRSHVLALPVHQDLTPRHVTYLAQQVSTVSRPHAALESIGAT